MTAIRALIRNHRHLAIALLVLAFGIKALVPAGFMISHSPSTVLTISICSESTGTVEAMEVVIPMKDGGAAQPGKGMSMACAFACLGHLAIIGADALLLGIALAFILALGFAPAPRPSFRRFAYLQPPLRGPPARA